MIYCSNITVTTTMLLRAKNTVNHCVSTQSREQLIGLKIQPLSDPQQRHLTIESSEAARGFKVKTGQKIYIGPIQFAGNEI